MNDWFVGIDLGQTQDYTAICVIERVIQHTGQLVQNDDGMMVEQRRALFHLRHLERPQLGTPYTAIVDRTRKLVSMLRATRRRVWLVADATGVGAPVMDMFRAKGLQPIAVHIHGGDKVSGEERDYRVPKRDLAGTLQSLLQTGRLKVAAKLELGEVFVKELLAFKVKVNLATGHDSYEALREGDHDDLVLAVAMPCWFATKAMRVAYRNLENLAI